VNGVAGAAEGDVMAARGPRSFDPVLVGQRECDAWAAYYRHDWRHFLTAAVAMVAAGFGMNRRRTLAGAWLVLRANQAWAPYPANDPDRARELMRRFYALVAADGQLQLEPGEAARREVEWWRVHRQHQREDGLTEDDLTGALVDLYSYVYGLPGQSVRPAAYLRVVAMRLSDEWVEAGCDLASPLLAEERLTLVASYAALREGIDRETPQAGRTRPAGSG
jgi:hypothetical protein